MVQLINNNLSNKFKQLADLFDRPLAVLRQRFDGQTVTEEAVSYVLDVPGKRVRPVLAFAAAELLDLEPEPVFPFALALELLHTASLIHDDLPSLDDDDLRRGRPTLHKVFSEGVAVLTGDLLISEAFLCLTRSELPAEAVCALTDLLAWASREIAEGQVMDLESAESFFRHERKEQEARLQKRHEKKTAALFKAAFCGPAQLLPDIQQRAIHSAALSRAGEAFGMLFQITDDLLDVTGETERMGKHAGTDSRRDRVSYVALHGVDRARERAAKLSQEVARVLEPYGEKSEFLVQLTEEIRSRRS